MHPDRLLPPAGRRWIGAICYEIGHALEPTSTAHRPGSPPAGPRIDPIWGYGGWCGLTPSSGSEAIPAAGVPESPGGYALGPLRSRTGRSRYTAAAAEAIRLVHAGDAYQVNLAHPLVGRFEGCPRALFADLAAAADPAFGCYAELPPLPDGRRRCILGLSPELLLRYDAATRRLTTEPMKGTRPQSRHARRDLEHAAKDRAELAMIVDLMRNDLGRVAEVGSVRVDQPRRVDRHGRDAAGVWQASARVSATLRRKLSLHDALRAVLPAGSITGAPKVRAMQAIHALENEPRGAYCGAIGSIDERGNAELAVGIRTATIAGDRFRYWVGAGIVADSDPHAEWSETLAKAAPLRAIGVEIEDDAGGDAP